MNRLSGLLEPPKQKNRLAGLFEQDTAPPQKNRLAGLFEQEATNPSPDMTKAADQWLAPEQFGIEQEEGGRSRGHGATGSRGPQTNRYAVGGMGGFAPGITQETAPYKEVHPVEAAKEIPGALAAGTERGLGAVGTAIQYAGDAMKAQRLPSAAPMGPTGYVLNAVQAVRMIADKTGFAGGVKLYDKISDSLTKSGKYIADYWEEQATHGWEAPDPKLMEEKWNRPLQYGTRVTMESAPTFLAAIGAGYITKSPNVSLAMMGVYEKMNAYRAQREMGGGFNEADFISTMSGTWEAVTEKIPFDFILKGGGKSRLIKAVTGGGLESIQELLAGMGQNFLEYFGYNAKDWDSVPGAIKEGMKHTLDNWLESVVAGGVLGGGAGAIVSGRGPATDIAQPQPEPPFIGKQGAEISRGLPIQESPEAPVPVQEQEVDLTKTLSPEAKAKHEALMKEREGGKGEGKAIDALRRVGEAQTDVLDAINQYGYGGVTDAEQHPALVTARKTREVAENELFNTLSNKVRIGDEIDGYVLRQAKFDMSQTVDTQLKTGVPVTFGFRGVEGVNKKGDVRTFYEDRVGQIKSKELFKEFLKPQDAQKTLAAPQAKTDHITEVDKKVGDEAGQSPAHATKEAKEKPDIIRDDLIKKYGQEKWDKVFFELAEGGENDRFNDLDGQIQELDEAGKFNSPEAKKLRLEYEQIVGAALEKQYGFMTKLQEDLAAIKKSDAISSKFDWKTSKVGDVTPMGETVLAQRIKTKTEAKKIAKEQGGHISIDGLRTWAVLKPVAEEQRLEKGEKKVELTEWDVESKKIRDRTAKEIRKNPIYQATLDSQKEQHEKFGYGKIFVPEKYRGEVAKAIGDHPHLRFMITYDRFAGKHYDEALMEIGEPQMDIGEFFDLMAEQLKARKKTRTLNDAALEVMASSREADAEILAAKYELSDQALTAKEINDNIREIAAYYRMPEEAIQEYLIDVKEKRKVGPGVERKTPPGKVKAKTKKAPAKKARPKDLLGREVLQGGASGKQLTLGLEIYKDAVPPTDVPTKSTLQDAVAKALNKDAQKVLDSKRKYKGVKNEKQLYEKYSFNDELFIHPDKPYPEMRAAWTIATKGKGLFGAKKAKGGGSGGSSVAAASAQATGGGYGTIASSEKTKFAETTNKKRFRDAVPDKNGIKAVDELMKGISPASREGARAGARVLRKNLGRLAQETVVAHEALRKAHHAFTFMSRSDAYDFIDRLENGQQQKEPKLNEIANSFRKMLDGRRDTVQNLGKGHLESFYENYFPHIWKDPSAAKKAIMQIFGKRRLEGSKSFLKKRSIMTVKEGREAGLELVSENPVDLVLLKVFEMDRYIMAQRVIQELKAKGLIKFVYSRSKSPDGYVKVNDNAFTVYMPPEITKKEAYDQLLVDQMMDIARSMGIDTDRFVAIGGKRWGFAQWEGSPETGPHKIRTKYAGPESVLAHEIGHVLGYKYNLYETIRRKKDGAYREVTRGEHKGEQKFVPTKEAIDHRKTIDKEWRDLADARYKGTQTTPGYKKYVRKAREKEAVLLEALIHAPDEFKKVAPTLHGLFTKFLNSHSELRPILDMKPSLVLGSSDAAIKVPGFTTLGHYYAPEPVGKLLNNYLSPGLRNSENQIIASGYNMIRMAGNVLNQAQLALSFFHGLNVTTDMIASTYGLGLRQLSVKGQRLEGISHMVLSGLSPIGRLWDGTRLRKAYRQQIDTIKDPRLQAMVRAIILADGRDRLDPFYYNRAIKALKKTAGDLMHGSPKQKITGVFKLPFQTFGATLEVMAKPLMEWYVPTGKLGLFSMLAKHEMKRAESGQINDEQLHERLISSWDSVDNRMGQLVYDNLFWNKTFKDVAMMAVRSVGWNLGSWREYGGVPVDILGTKGRIARGDVWLSQKMAYTIGAITQYAILGAVIGYLLTGKRPEELKDYFFPKTGEKNPDGSDERLSLPTYAKDWFAYGIQPRRTVKNKLHPIWGLLTDLVENKDFFHVQIRDPKDPISQQLLDVAEYIGKEFLPLSARNYQKMSRTSPDRSHKNIWVSITGITTAPSYITRSPAQRLMYRYIIENIPDKTRTKEEYERMRERQEFRKSNPEKSFADSFKRLSIGQAINVYAIATPVEKRKSYRILRQKWDNARRETKTPELGNLYIEVITGARE